MGLTWKEVHSQNTAALMQTLLNASDQIGSSIGEIGTVAENFAQKQTDDQTAKLLASISGVDNAATRQSMINAAAEQTDFLDFDKIRTVNWELGAADRAEELALFEDEIADANALDLFEREQTLETEAQANRFEIIEKEFDYSVDAAIEAQKLTEAALDAAHTRSLEEAKQRAKVAEEKAILAAASKQEIEKIKQTAANELKIELAKIEDKYLLEKQGLEIKAEADENYLEQLANTPLGIKGIYEKAGWDGTLDSIGADSNDTGSYQKMRTVVLQKLGIDASNQAAIAHYDRWAAQAINFNNNFGALFDMNDFTFTDVNGETIHFGFGQTGTSYALSNESDSLVAAYKESKIISDIQGSLFSDYKKSQGGDASLREYHNAWYGFRQYVSDLDVNKDADKANDIELNVKNAKRLFTDYLEQNTL